jgi:hypothetical protein
MRCILFRSGPWLLALGVVLTGCSQSGDRSPKASVPSSVEVVPGASEVVLTVEGMS